MAKKPSNAVYYSIDLAGKSKAFLAIYAKIDDALQAAKDTLQSEGSKLVAQAIKEGFTVPAGKEARVLQNRFGGGLQIVVDDPRSSSAAKKF